MTSPPYSTPSPHGVGGPTEVEPTDFEVAATPTFEPVCTIRQVVRRKGPATTAKY
jgi:hypothetical protein